MRDGHTAQPSVHKTYVGQTLSWRGVASICKVDVDGTLLHCTMYCERIKRGRDHGIMNPDTDTILSVNFLTLTEPPRRRQKVPDKICKLFSSAVLHQTMACKWLRKSMSLFLSYMNMFPNSLYVCACLYMSTSWGSYVRGYWNEIKQTQKAHTRNTQQCTYII